MDVELEPAPVSPEQAARILGATSNKYGPRRRRTNEEIAMSKADAMQVLHWKLFKGITAIPGDVREYIERVWAARIPHLYEELFLMAKDNQPINPNAIDLLKTMTLMCRSLTPANLRADSNADALGLPSDVDLSHISTADLARMTRKELSAPLDVAELDRKAAHAKMMREKRNAVKAGHAKAVGAHSDRAKRKKKTIPDAGRPPIDGGA